MYQSDEMTMFLVNQAKHPAADKCYREEHGESVEEWAGRTREWAVRQLHYQPEKVPLAPEVTDEQDFGSYTRRKVFYHSAADCRVSAYLLTPKNLERPAPGILALHDHSGQYYHGKEKLVDHKSPQPVLDWFQHFRYGGRGFASTLAEMGYMVLCPDTIGWGERRFLDVSWLGPRKYDLLRYGEGTAEYITAFNEQYGACENRLMDAIAFVGATFPGIFCWDDMRSLDYLCSLPEVDSSRIGSIGLSMGGYRSAFLGALDPRITCCCIAGYLTRFEDLGPKRSPVGWGVPGLFNRLPYPDFVSLAAPKPLLSLNCENDSLFDLSTIEAAARRVKEVYTLAGAADNFAVQNFPVGHQFGLAMQEAAFDFLRKHL